MKNVLRFAILLLACAVYLQSGWVSYSKDKSCPTQEPSQDMTVELNFLAAHGLTQEEFSIWLREHSVWRRENAEELRMFTFIPQDNDPERK